MCVRPSRTCGWILCLLMTVALMMTVSCHHGTVEKETPVPAISKVVVLGFRAALSPGDEPNVVRDPFSGGVYDADPVSPAVVHKMNDTLFEKLLAENRYQLISPDQAQGVVSSIVRSDVKVGLQPIKLVQEVGQTFGADAVVAGHIFRWRER